MVESNIVCLVLSLFQNQIDGDNKSSGLILVQVRLGVLYNEKKKCTYISITIG